MAAKFKAFGVLAQSRRNHSNPIHVDRGMSELATELQTHLSGIQERLKQFVYPFAHARGRLTVAEYARYEKHVDNDLERVYLDTKAYLDRLFPLHYRLIGRVLAAADTAESSLQKN
jgi:hypothetical protein